MSANILAEAIYKVDIVRFFTLILNVVWQNTKYFLSHVEVELKSDS